MASFTKSISAAIKSIPAKKESLRKAFEDLQSHSTSLSSFTLQWNDIEAHFNSIEKSIETSFKEVELEEKEKEKEKSKEKTPVKKSDEKSIKQKEDSIEVTPRPELKSLCEKMDGMGLRSFINENRKEIPTLRNEITEAIRLAPDPGKMVLDAMEGFYTSDDLNLKGDKDVELAGIRRSCIHLLERLVFISPEIINIHKERAKKLAVEWKRKISPGGDNALEIIGFMQLLVTFGLVSAFDVEELFDLFVFVARRDQVIDLFKALDLAEKVPDFIQKLASMGKQLQAVKFVYAFGLVDKFPPGPLLKAYLKESKKVAQEIRKKGNNSAMSQNEATEKEVAAVKAVIQYVKEHKLETEFSSMNLWNRISQLKRAALAGKKRISQQKEDRKHEAPTPPTAQPPNKKPRPAATTTAYVPPPTAPQRAQPSGPLVDWIPSYSGSAAPYSGPAGPYSGSAAPYSGLAGPYSGSAAPYSGPAGPYSGSAAPYSGPAGPYSGSAAPYSGPAGPYSGSAAPYSGPAGTYSGSAGPYSGSASYVGEPLGFGVQNSPSKSHLYSSEHLLGSSMYDMPLGYSGYSLSGGLSYHPPYYP
ncbi:FRIGIDA-like protein 1 isoform X2 [Tasmannia lanceolata]|uniref:FRIGIDA-like protein 1 isoform X2 n=1 Tax=Tasmannia lanceolata TaxID=3420 RepID=UPI00406312EA